MERSLLSEKRTIMLVMRSRLCFPKIEPVTGLLVKHWHEWLTGRQLLIIFQKTQSFFFLNWTSIQFRSLYIMIEAKLSNLTFTQLLNITEWSGNNKMLAEDGRRFGIGMGSACFDLLEREREKMFSSYYFCNIIILIFCPPCSLNYFGLITSDIFLISHFLVKLFLSLPGLRFGFGGWRHLLCIS